MYIIGTAGHVDHGKSTLVKALTGIDPDRLREEKERGMTIDLGFAWFRLTNGKEISVVDVPGHERFVNNMLAGVGSIDLALLIVAADESVMPQTREHLAILDLLNIKRGLVVVTKKDLVEDDWLNLVIADVEELLMGTTIEGSPLISVSAMTQEGLPDLVSAIERLLEGEQSREDLGRPRLSIDRSFTVSGFGTVVTGTLVDGALDVGQEVELLPTGRISRIRGLEMHRQQLNQAVPGSRVAVNLTGISHEDISRGDVLATPGWLKPTTAIDVHLRVIPEAPRPIRHNMFATVHIGSSEKVARVRLLEKQVAEPGDITWAQFKLDSPIALVKGDHFVIRSNQTTLGGGSIVDSHARRHRRRYKPVIERLSIMENGSDRDILLRSIEFSEPAEFLTLVNRANLQLSSARSVLEEMRSEGVVIILGGTSMESGFFVFTVPGWTSLAAKARAFLKSYHKQFPLRKGVPKEELRNRIGMMPRIFNHALARLQEDGILVEEGTIVRSPQYRRQLTNVQQVEADNYLRLLKSNPYSPPTNSPVDPEVLNLLADEGKVVKVNESVVFAISTHKEMVERISACISEHGEITVADVRDMFKTSRKYALAFLENLDQQRITRRVGDTRVLR